MDTIYCNFLQFPLFPAGSDLAREVDLRPHLPLQSDLLVTSTSINTRSTTVVDMAVVITTTIITASTKNPRSSRYPFFLYSILLLLCIYDPLYVFNIRTSYYFDLLLSDM